MSFSLEEALECALKELKRIDREGAPQPRMVSQLAIGMAEEVLGKCDCPPFHYNNCQIKRSKK